MTWSKTSGAWHAVSPVGANLAEVASLRSASAPDQSFVESATGVRRVTYGELWAATVHWAALLGDLGVPVGATVGLSVSDPLDFTFVFIGVMAAGRMAAPLDPGAADAELSAVCGRTGPLLVVSDRATPTMPVCDWVTMPTGTFSLATSGPSQSLDPPVLVAGKIPTGGLVLSTSGTTGVPKVIRLDQRALLHTAEAVATHHQLSVEDRGFNPLPLFHINAEVVGLLSTLVAGATLVLDDRFHRRGFWGTMGRHRVTWINAVPAILARLSELDDGETVPEGIRFARSASAPLPPSVLKRFERTTGIRVLETYGMTEAASQITANPLDGVRKPGSVGRPVGTEVRVSRDGSATAGVGRVSIRGPSVIRSYAAHGYEDRFDRDGWLDTGDLGYIDEDGYLFLVGRADDVINRGGEKIYPREVEDVILEEPGVAAVVVVGWDHEVLGRVPVAYLVADGVEGPSDRWAAEELVAALQKRCAQNLSRPKRPVAFHVVERLPQGATGKVQRRAIGDGSTIYTLLTW